MYMHGVMSARTKAEVSHRVTRVELDSSLDSVLAQLDLSMLTADSDQFGERAKQSDGSSEFALYVVVEPGRFLPALGVRALRARLCRIENSRIALEVTSALSADRCVPLRGYIYEENGATVLLTYDRSSTVLRAKEGRSNTQNISACVTRSGGTSTVGM